MVLRCILALLSAPKGVLPEDDQTINVFFHCFMMNTQVIVATVYTRKISSELTVDVPFQVKLLEAFDYFYHMAQFRFVTLESSVMLLKILHSIMIYAVDEDLLNKMKHRISDIAGLYVQIAWPDIKIIQVIILLFYNS